MTSKIEKFKDISNQIDGLGFDAHKLQELIQRTNMLINLSFGEKSYYKKELDDILFHPGDFFEQATSEEIRGQLISGKKYFKSLINVMIEELEIKEDNKPNTEKPQNLKIDNKKVFIVHGHDNEMKITVARFIDKLGLEAIILHELPNKGRTIIEKFSDHSNVGFAIVLLSGDDFGYKKSLNDSDKKLRARQNVVLELGYFMGKIGRGRTLPLFESGKNIELPSDYEGVLYVPYDSTNSWHNDVVRELKAAGYDIDANILFK
ncbi:TIR domain-containing protein [Chryseobacterium balustinum]|uniref:TIR domain-containing protein n=1 Tax=Chryseobacterium balustinum TaxID=246 RepID=UPI003CE76BE0